MRPFRLLLSLTSCVLAITFFLYLSIADPNEPPNDRTETKKNGLGALFSFHGPLFPPSAIISLTDDNSTFFLARPAAFGPLLPSRGLSGQLWIGSGFADDAYGHGHAGVLAEGELGCGDSPSWDDHFGYSSHSRETSREPGRGHRRHKNLGAKAEAREADRWERLREEDLQSLQESTDIAGKIVLLSRGGCGFLEKVEWAQRRGGVAVIIGDNVRGGPIITMYARGDTSNVSIPALFTSRTTAHLLSTLVPSGGAFGFSPESQGQHDSVQESSPEDKALFDHKVDTSHLLPNPESTAFDVEQNISDKGWLERFLSFFGLYGSPPMRELGESAHRQSGHYVSQGAERTDELDARASSSFPRSSELNMQSGQYHGAHNGLWVTLTPTNMSSNPFLDTLLVLVVSPLVTLTVVYALLLLRSRMQRRRWRAPKSVVDRLPVRTYHTLSSSSPLATPASSSPTTPLLQTSHRPYNESQPQDLASSSDGRDLTMSSDHEKRDSGLAEWRRRYGGRQRECVVCLDEYVDGVSRVMSLPCGHEFHAECITPWLTTRRRTCPICKGDVVRSMARNDSHHSRSRSTHTSHDARQQHNQSHISSGETLSFEGSLSEEDIQTEAAVRRNDSPSAAMPIPSTADTTNPADGYEDDLERGPESAPEVRPRMEGSNIWRRVGSLGIPTFGRFGTDASHARRMEQRPERVDRDR